MDNCCCTFGRPVNDGCCSYPSILDQQITRGRREHKNTQCTRPDWQCLYSGKSRGGQVGKVQVTIHNSLREMPAITEDDTDRATGTVIKVVGIVSNSILVVQKM